MNVFVTGASGYIGGSVAMALVRKNYAVRGLTRSAAAGQQMAANGITPVIGDLDDSRLLSNEASRADVVVNTAHADHKGAVEALLAGLMNSGKRLIHTSGSSIVGDDVRGEFRSEAVFSEDTPLQIDPRKQARREIDLLVLGGAERGVVASVIIPSLIYGEGSGVNPHSIQVPFLIRNALEAGAVQIVGKGLNTWSNVHIDDLVDLYVLAVERAPAGAFYFAENGEASFLQVGEAISRRFAIPKIEHLPADVAVERWGMARALFTFGSNSRVRAIRARRELGWQPVHTSVQDWIQAANSSV